MPILALNLTQHQAALQQLAQQLNMPIYFDQNQNTDRPYRIVLLGYDGFENLASSIANFSKQHIPVLLCANSYIAHLKEVYAQTMIMDYVVLQESNDVWQEVGQKIERLNLNRQTKALIVDDSATFRLQNSLYLKAMGLDVLTANDGHEALSILKQESIRLLLTDFNMPNMDGFELTIAARKLKNKAELAIIVLTANDSANAVSFLKVGANDFLRKPYSREELTCRVDQNLDLLYLMDQLHDTANRDFLSKLHNRRYFLTHAEAAITKAQQNNTPVALAMLDIDHFKKINDTYGHDAGDQALRSLASVLESSLNQQAIYARLGGEEFAMLFVGDHAQNVETLLETLRMNIAQTTIEAINVARFYQTVSIGYCLLDDTTNTLHAAMTKADKALYTAKQQGRNRVIKAPA